METETRNRLVFDPYQTQAQIRFADGSAGAIWTNKEDAIVDIRVYRRQRKISKQEMGSFIKEILFSSLWSEYTDFEDASFFILGQIFENDGEYRQLKNPSVSGVFRRQQKTYCYILGDGESIPIPLTSKAAGLSLVAMLSELQIISDTEAMVLEQTINTLTALPKREFDPTMN